jgi:hypothetical protein
MWLPYLLGHSSFRAMLAAAVDKQPSSVVAFGPIHPNHADSTLQEPPHRGVCRL